MTTFAPNSTAVSVLTDHEIERAIDTRELTVDPFDPMLIRPAALSLRLGHKAYSLASSGVVDTADPATYPELLPRKLDERGRLRVDPDEVLLAPTLERIGLSTGLAGLLDGTSSYARLGINVVLSGQVSPGFGRTTPAVLTLEIVNHLRHPVLLRPGARICNLMLLPCNGSAVPYDELPFSYGGDQAVSASRLASHLAWQTERIARGD
jgi:dCTP deaminase